MELLQLNSVLREERALEHKFEYLILMFHMDMNWRMCTAETSTDVAQILSTVFYDDQMNDYYLKYAN